MLTKSHFIPLFFTVLVISLLCGAEVDLFIPSFPEIRKVFELSPFQVQLTLSANFLAYSTCSIR
jgi:DHA1 family bicyclomycin/chloramphenicol resistance-like MFS transporter